MMERGVILVQAQYLPRFIHIDRKTDRQAYIQRQDM